MWSSDLLIVGLSATIWTLGASTRAGSTEIRCPLMHNGKTLTDVGLFDGPPAEHAELIPRNGGWDVPDHALSPVLPNFTLGCTYRGLTEMVTVVLPRSIRVCEFRNYPQVDCH